MTQLVPALLAPTPGQLTEQLAKVGSLSPLLSYDVVDGTLVAPASPFPGEYPSPPDGTAIFWHLMVTDPVVLLPVCLRFPTKMVALHIEATGFIPAMTQLRDRGVPVGLTLNPETMVSAVEPWLATIDFVQLMTVEPGGQGRPFQPAVLKKIDELRALRSDLQLVIDGGINRATIEQVRSYAVDYIVVGSALTGVEQPQAEYEALQTLLR